MELDNYNIILIDYLYKYEIIDDNIKQVFWELKNEIYKLCLYNDKLLEKNELIELELKIIEFYKLFPNFNFEKAYNHDNPILYITYLSHIKDKLSF